MLTGDEPAHHAGVRERLARLGFADFVAYVAWCCERALERGLLPHTNLGALGRDDLARLREVTASQGLMLESLRPDLVAHQGSPTKDPALRLAHAARGRGAEDPVHQRHPGRHRRDRGRPHGGARGARRLRQPAGGHPAELRPAPALLRRGAGRDRDRGGGVVLAHRAARGPGRARPGVVVARDRGRHGAPRRRGAPADAGGRHPGPAQPRRLVAAAGRGGRDRPRRAQRQRRPHLARAPVPVAQPGAQAARRRRRRADRAALRLPALHRSRVARAGRARRDQGALLELHPAPRLRPHRRAEGRAAARHDRPRARRRARWPPGS